MATQAQYDAAQKAIKQLCDHMIATQVPIFEQGLARKALTDDRLNQFAKVSVDAALEVSK